MNALAIQMPNVRRALEPDPDINALAMLAAVGQRGGMNALAMPNAMRAMPEFEMRGGGGAYSQFDTPAADPGEFGDLFARYESEAGLPSGYLARTAQIESGMDPRAQNPRSSAGGLFQFIDSTASQYGLSDRFDPAAATQAAARLASDNAGTLRSVLGRQPTARELYLAHQQGAGGARSLLSNPNARAADIVGAQAVRLNGGSPDMTAAEFARHVMDYYGG